MNCDSATGCGPDTHNLHCSYPNCNKGNTRKFATASDLWESGIEHHDESVQLIKLVNKLDTDDSVGLDLGGDGDLGETLAYFLDELINRGVIEIKITGKL